MNRFFSFSTACILILATQNCTDTSSQKTQPLVGATIPNSFPAIALAPAFNDYWYQGVAELCTYKVEQERYGEMREADQVNIFVTEDFSRSKQVKLDNAQAAGADKEPILKLNSLRRFETGIYDYSLMQSVFTPTSGAPTLKTTTTIQDWCGHVFMQMNLVPEGYKSRVFSYFESEGDQENLSPYTMLEDELWTKLRLSPFIIPTGAVKVLPSAWDARLRHKLIVVQNADIQIDKGVGESVLTLKYQTIPRTLQIRFETEFPYKIIGWEERNDGKLASKGTLVSTRRSAYWSEHNNEHAPLRDSLKVGHRR